MENIIKKKYALLLVCIGVTIGQAGFTLYLPSLPQITSAFNTSPNVAQLTLSLYVAGFGLLQLFYGPYSDAYGRKITLILGNSIFFIASLLCSFSPHIWFLNIMRFLQGAAIGANAVVGRAILAELYDGILLKRSLSIVAIATAITSVVAPAIGGNLQYYFSWQSNFIFLMMCSGLFLFFLITSLPETNRGDHLLQQDVAKVFNTYLTITKNSSFAYNSILCMIAISSISAYLSIAPFIFQDAFGLSPKQFGYISLGPAVGFLLGGIVSRLLERKLSVMREFILGTSLILLATAVMVISNMIYISWVLVLLAVTIFAVAVGILYPLAMSNTLGSSTRNKGAVAAVVGSTQMLASGVAIFVFSRLPLNNLNKLIAIFTFAFLLSSVIIFLQRNNYSKKDGQTSSMRI